MLDPLNQEVYDWLSSEGLTPLGTTDGFVFVGPDNKVAIHVLDLLSHNSLFDYPTSSHRNHYLIASKSGIRLIQIWSDEWVNKKDIVKEIILFALGKITRKIYARKCDIVTVSPSDANCFLDENHIQGAVNSNVRIGLTFNNELVGLQCYQAPMKIGKNFHDFWLLARTVFLRQTQVIGGISKMFKFFTESQKPHKVIDYTDLRTFVASGHYSMGFVRQEDTPPNKYWTDGHGIYHRRRFWNKVWRAEHGWNSDMTIKSNMARLGYGEVWDAGKAVNMWQPVV